MEYIQFNEVIEGNTAPNYNGKIICHAVINMKRITINGKLFAILLFDNTMTRITASGTVGGGLVHMITVCEPGL